LWDRTWISGVTPTWPLTTTPRSDIDTLAAATAALGRWCGLFRPATPGRFQAARRPADPEAEMATIPDLNRSFWHTQGVARSIGVGLTDALCDGRLNRMAYEEIVERCRDCPYDRDCEAWLAQPCEPADGAPKFCANKRLLDRIGAMSQPLSELRRNR